MEVKHENLNTTVSLVKLMPILKQLQNATRYVMVRGDETLFKIQEATTHRGATLHAINQLPRDSRHYVVIRGHVDSDIKVRVGMNIRGLPF